MNLANMMKQAQQMQKRLQDAQKDLAATEIIGEASNVQLLLLVTVKVNLKV